ncbi:Ff.00g117180.m01.CDS01 [Fusarium sp. VM40]|nr:Ff.00g117180.m01.CDS01 [Fusarium sp. VM40]
MGASPPPTPLPRAPHSGELRFKSITSPCEWIEDYYPGSYHPVIIGDLFDDGRYRVVRKLGEGSSSTVWLARDLRDARYVALKILVSKRTKSSQELQILHHLANVAPEDGAQYITQLVTEFEHHGPNGVHKCLVLEPMGPSVNSMVEELPQFKPRLRTMNIRYPPQMARSILKQSLQGLAFLHRNGIAHGDFHPGNMLFSLTDINGYEEDVLRQVENVESQSTSPPVVRRDGKQDKWAPRYLCIAQPLGSFASPVDEFRIKLSDMGGAYYFNNPPEEPTTPAGLRAPELVLKGEVNPSLDIWSFGCLVFELTTGQPLFCVPRLYSEAEQKEDHLLSLQERLGPLPDDLYCLWETSSQYYTPDRKLYNYQLGGVPEGEEPLEIPEQLSMEEAFDQTKPELDKEEAQKVKNLVRWILHYDPSKRPSADEILQDPWFAGA